MFIGALAFSSLFLLEFVLNYFSIYSIQNPCQLVSLVKVYVHVAFFFFFFFFFFLGF
jgi:hypothetical protein